MKTEGHKKYLQEQADWKGKRKSPDQGALYTWEDMYSVEKQGEREVMYLGFSMTIIMFAGMIVMSLIGK